MDGKEGALMPWDPTSAVPRIINLEANSREIQKLFKRIGLLESTVLAGEKESLGPKAPPPELKEPLS